MANELKGFDILIETSSDLLQKIAKNFLISAVSMMNKIQDGCRDPEI